MMQGNKHIWCDGSRTLLICWYNVNNIVGKNGCVIFGVSRINRLGFEKYTPSSTTSISIDDDHENVCGVSTNFVLQIRGEILDSWLVGGLDYA